MMQLTLDLDRKPEENDIIIFRNGMWHCLPLDTVLNEFRKNNNSTNTQLVNINDKYDDLKQQIKKIKEEIKVIKGED